MFICKKCLSKYEPIVCFSGSYGKCEFCGKIRMCDDIRPWVTLVPKKKQSKKKGGD
jgi:hypothetical protein